MTENSDPAAATPPVHTGKRAAYIGMGVLLVLAGALGIGGWGAYQERHAALQTSHRHRDFVPTVQVAEVLSAGDIFTVSLPATTQALPTTTRRTAVSRTIIDSSLTISG